MAEARRMVGGESKQLRVGYLASVGPDYVDPALTALRRLHPQVKTKLLDLTSGEQIIALRRGEIDLALAYLGSDLLSDDFYTRKVATVPSLAVLPLNHRLASQTQISISELKNEHFLRVPDTCAPGYNQKISQFCVQFGKFRPRFAAMRNLTSFAEGLSLSADEEEISLNPIFVSYLRIPNVVMVPIVDAGATWDLFVAWRRGKILRPAPRFAGRAHSQIWQVFVKARLGALPRRAPLPKRTSHFWEQILPVSGREAIDPVLH